MRDESRSKLRATIVRVLDEAPSETSLSDLLRRLQDLGVVDQTSVKEVIWQLIADRDVELTARRTLKVPQRYAGAFALAT